VQRLREAGSKLIDRVNAIVVIEVGAARAVVSSAYDGGLTTEADVIRVFQTRFARLHEAASS
jgi:hypothetical protein